MKYSYKNHQYLETLNVLDSLRRLVLALNLYLDTFPDYILLFLFFLSKLYN